jgi:hypothetical protein
VQALGETTDGDLGSWKSHLRLTTEGYPSEGASGHLSVCWARRCSTGSKSPGHAWVVP